MLNGGSAKARATDRASTTSFMKSRQSIFLMQSIGMCSIDLRFRWLGSLDGFVDFLAVDRHRLGGSDPQPDLVAANFNDSDAHVIVNDDTLVLFSGKNKHGGLLLDLC